MDYLQGSCLRWSICWPDQPDSGGGRASDGRASHRHRLVCDYGCLAYVGQNLSGCRWCMERDSRADKIPRYYAVAGCLNYLLVCLPQRPMTYYTKDVLTGFGVLAAMMLFAAAYI